MVLSSVVGSLALAATPEPDPFELSPEQLFNATVMSVSRSEEKLWDAPAAVYVLNSEDIKRSGATSIPEALRMVPGVNVAQSNAGNWAVSIRGFNGELANKLLVLIDGREVYDPLFSGVFWNVQDVMMEDLDRIEVVRGPGASLWGANAVNGVINIVTKKAGETQGNLASVTLGTSDRATVSERYGGKLGDSGHYRFYGKYLNRADNDTPTGANARDEQIATRGGWRADWKNGQGDDFTFQGDIYENSDGGLRTIPVFSPTYTPPFSALAEENVDSRGGNMAGRWSRGFDDGGRATVRSYLDYVERNPLLGASSRVTYNLDTQMQMPQEGRHAIVYGAAYRLSHVELSNPSPLLFYLDDTRNDQLFSTFLQDKITLSDRWLMTLGSKFEYNDYTGFEYEPTARLQFYPDDRQMVWGAVSRAVRTPSILETNLHAVQGVNGAVSLDTMPNPYLDSEELIAYELGYRRQLTPEASLDLTAFYNDYDKLVDYSFIGTTSLSGNPIPHGVIELVPVNAGSGSSYGVEAVLDWHVLPSLRLSTNYSLLKMELEQPFAFGTTNATEGQSPQQQFSIRPQWDINDEVTLDGMLYYTDELSDFGLPGYWGLNTRLGWKAAPGLEFSLVGQNLLYDHHQEFVNETSASAVDIQRAVYGKVTWQF